MRQRLQKFFSDRGIMARRKAEEAIAAGRVTVNGQRAELGQQADPDTDEICLDGTPILEQREKVYLMLHKPAGCVTTLADPQGRPNVSQLVAGCGVRVFPVGRLDFNSEGLLLMTNDGELTFRLTHPKNCVEKEYQLRVIGNVRQGLPILTGPMELDGRPLAPAQLRVLKDSGGSALLSVVIHEGRNRQLRRMCQAAGLRVVRLRRVREGPLELGDLPAGQWRYLTPEEEAALVRHAAACGDGLPG